MNDNPEIIGYRAIRHIATGEVVTDFAPVYASDWPYGAVAPNQALCRYMDFWKFADLFDTQDLYFCRADKFADPLEGTISRAGIHGTSKSDRAFSNMVRVSPTAYAEALDYRATAKACTFVNCWHINTNESQEMWEAYTASNDSVLLITTAERLAESLKFPVIGSAVRYLPEGAPRTEFDERSLFFYKDISFEFEREFRLLIDLMMLGGSIQRDNPADFFRRVPVDLNTLVYAIQLHPSATSEIKAKIAALVKKHLPSATEEG